jgi:hypothetical protein
VQGARALSDALHPRHDELAEELRGWYRASVPSMGITVHDTWYGYLSDADGADAPRLLLTVDDADCIDDVLRETAALRAGGGTIWVDDRARAAALEPALVTAGCRLVRSTTCLALVGPVRAELGPSALTVEVVDDARLATWASVKLRGFADSEDEPSAEAVRRELAVRRAEWAEVELWLASLDGEAVAILGFYPGDLQLAFNLATRVPVRHRHLARSLLARWAAAATESGCDALVINADDHGRPAALYQRLGFVDEVHWFRRWAWGTTPPSG